MGIPTEMIDRWQAEGSHEVVTGAKRISAGFSVEDEQCSDLLRGQVRIHGGDNYMPLEIQNKRVILWTWDGICNWINRL
jgi:hypothetical protein